MDNHLGHRSHRILDPGVAPHEKSLVKAAVYPVAVKSYCVSCIKHKQIEAIGVSKTKEEIVYAGVAGTKVDYGETHAVRLIDFLKECTHLKGHLHNGSLLFGGHYIIFVAYFINKAEVIDKYIVPELLLEGIVHIVPVAVAAGFLIEDAEDGDLLAALPGTPRCAT